MQPYMCCVIHNYRNGMKCCYATYDFGFGSNLQELNHACMHGISKFIELHHDKTYIYRHNDMLSSLCIYGQYVVSLRESILFFPIDELAWPYMLSMIFLLVFSIQWNPS